jgi:hypothetical protein
MLRQHTRQEMTKASLWLTKEEYRKICALSGHLSVNAYLMAAVRKAIAAAEKEEVQKEEMLSGPIFAGASPTAATAVGAVDLPCPQKQIPGDGNSDAK